MHTTLINVARFSHETQEYRNTAGIACLTEQQEWIWYGKCCQMHCGF